MGHDAGHLTAHVGNSAHFSKLSAARVKVREQRTARSPRRNFGEAIVDDSGNERRPNDYFA